MKNVTFNIYFILKLSKENKRKCGSMIVFLFEIF